MTRPLSLISTLLIFPFAGALAVDLTESLHPSPIKPLAPGSVTIAGRANIPDGAPVQVRITTSLGQPFATKVAAQAGRFECRFPQDFAGAPALSPSLLYVDATDAAEFGGKDLVEHQAEAVLIVSGEGQTVPDLPLVFTDDFIDAAGHKDAQCAQWPRQRELTNLFLHSRAAQLMHIRKPGFDLAAPTDFAWFKDHATLYDFDQRDRDWSQPLNHRVARGFWQAVWNSWFNAGNDHPWDGNPANHAPTNFRPYTFANDPADLLVLYRMLQAVTPCVADNRRALADEVLANLLAMQHRSPENFALPETSGRQEHYTAGAFRYGMFETGEWMTEGNGWFVNPQFRDFARGGVFNGRAVWALGESWKAEPYGPLSAQIREALVLALRFCLHDGLAHDYTWKTKSGQPVWNHTAGEHAYLLLGLLAACEVEPELSIPLAGDQPASPLREVTANALDALVETAGPDGNWTHYANAAAVNIAALAEGARVFPSHPHAAPWIAAARKAADLWLALQPLPAEHHTPTPMFGHMMKDGGLTFYLGKRARPSVALYVGGHWIHALAVLHTVTHEPHYAERAHALLAYYCGDNPARVRLLDELGAVNNGLTDAHGSGTEDQIGWDAYPESTAFVQIGLLHLLRR